MELDTNDPINQFSSRRSEVSKERDGAKVRRILLKVNEVNMFTRRGKGLKFFTDLTIVFVFLGGP